MQLLPKGHLDGPSLGAAAGCHHCSLDTEIYEANYLAGIDFG
jgi:hypothetical protein